MKITILGSGTSQGVPIIGCNCRVCSSSDDRDMRLRSSIFIENPMEKILIDCGPDFRQQALRTNLSSITAVLQTHEHADHFLGMDDLRPVIFKQGKNIPVFGQKRVLKRVREVYDYAFENDYPGIPQFDLHEIDELPFTIGTTEIIPIKLQHAHREVLGYRINDFAYLTDFNQISDQSLQKLMGVRVLVISALRNKKHYSHLSLPEALQLIMQINPNRAYLTHVSHELGLFEEVQKTLPQNVFLAYDGLAV